MRWQFPREAVDKVDLRLEISDISANRQLQMPAAPRRKKLEQRVLLIEWRWNGHFDRDWNSASERIYCKAKTSRRPAPVQAGVVGDMRCHRPVRTEGQCLEGEVQVCHRIQTCNTCAA